MDFTTIGTGWFFERELTGLEPTAGIRITHGQVVPLGAPTPLSDLEIKCTLIESGHQPEPIETDDPMSNNSEDIAEDEAKINEPSVRIIRPMLEVSDDEEPDAIISAVRQTNTESLPIHQPVQQSMTGLCRREGIAQSLYYKWS